jgi:hypothetical protein
MGNESPSSGRQVRDRRPPLDQLNPLAKELAGPLCLGQCQCSPDRHIRGTIEHTGIAEWKHEPEAKCANRHP